MDKDLIISEIQRTAVANGGKPLGRLRLEREAGIKEYHWKRHWSRYNDALRAAGFEPNAITVAYTRDEVLQRVTELARRLGRFPTQSDMLVASQDGSGFPTPKTVVRRFGNKAGLVATVADYCAREGGLDDVAGFCASEAPASGRAVAAEGKLNTANDGFVYLLRSGRFFKIGRTNHVGRRERELTIQLPEPASTVHSIRTDDPEGIEAYWHRRFAEKRKNGEWFDLTREDVAVFRRRKFM